MDNLLVYFFLCAFQYCWPCAGMRGMIAMSIEVKGPTRDLHSGNEGGTHPALLKGSKILRRYFAIACHLVLVAILYPSALLASATVE